MRVATVAGPPAAPAGPAFGFDVQQVLTVPQHHLLNNWTCRTLALVASNAPDTVAPIVASINNLRQELTTINADCRNDEEEKARIAALPQTFAKRFGTPVCEEVMRYVEVDSMDDLPPLLKTLGSHANQANDHVAMASKTFAILFGLGNDAFSNHDRPCVDTLAKFAAVTAAPGHKAEVLGYPDAFPTLCALISNDDPTSILLGSSPTLYRGIAGIASNTDNRVVMFLGNSEEGVFPFVVPNGAFGPLSNAEAVNVSIDTNAHHAAHTALGAGVNHIPTIGNNVASERVQPR